MKVSLSWLSDYVNFDLPAAELAHQLTMSGTEVGGVETIGGNWDNIFVGELLGIDPHPNADRLRLASVELNGQRHQVVCGAPNLTVGGKIAFATVGARLMDGHTGKLITLKAAKIRGVESAGMVCSKRELDLSDEHEGILELPDDAPVGAPLAGYLGDSIFDLELTPNRPDCLGVIGIAREVAALTGGAVREPAGDYVESGPPIAELASVQVEDPDLCPRYAASVVFDVKIGQSPDWMQRRLVAAGMRPINNLVDITNYVMLEHGQPLHAFDYDKLADHRIVVRRAGDDRTMRTLDGVERRLDPNMLLICDGAGPVALAGVMGGGDSELTDATTRVLIESANFDAGSIRGTETRLRLRSEASLRSDKGLSQETTMTALRRATGLMVEIAGGSAAQGVIDLYPGRVEQAAIRFGAAEIERLLGAEFSAELIKETLEKLGFECRPTGATGEEFDVVPPSWRMDVTMTADLVEEVARIVGYDEIPVTTLRAALPAEIPDKERELRERLKDILVGLGCQEVISYASLGLAAIERSLPGGVSTELPAPIRLANPMSEEQAYLRTTLRASLLQSLAANQRYNEAPIRLFEVGKIFLDRPNDLPDEPYLVDIILAGPREPAGWHGSTAETDFFDAKGTLDALFATLGVAASYSSFDGANFYMPGQAAELSAGNAIIGSLGRISSSVLTQFEIDLAGVYHASLGLAPLLSAVPSDLDYRAVTRFPDLLRDLAIVVDATTPAAAVAAIVEQTKMVRDVRLFDVYEGAPLDAGKKSLAFTVRYQADDRTLTEQEIERIHRGIVTRLERELGAALRT